MHLTALVDSPEHVCCRYRLAAFRSHLRAAGHTLNLHAIPQSPLSRLRLFHDLRGQTVILQRKLLPFWERALLRRRVRCLVFDFDDAVFLRDSFSAKGLHHPGRLRRFAALVRHCDVVVAGNHFLAEQAARWAGPGCVRIVPTCVDPGRYPQASHRAGQGGVHLVWVGSSSTLQGLRAIAPLLQALGRQIPGLRLKVICDRSLDLESLPVVATPWSEATEGAEIAAGDIGISWVPDDLWSRGKCGLKLLQYMAAGLPVVANPVGVHAEMVRHGETGYLAEGPADWIEAVRRLAGDPELRRRMGAAGRRRLLAEYSVTEGGRRWTALVAGLERSRARAG